MTSEMLKDDADAIPTEWKDWRIVKLPENGTALIGGA